MNLYVKLEHIIKMKYYTIIFIYIYYELSNIVATNVLIKQNINDNFFPIMSI